MWESGPAWINDGVVKYHFIEDAPAAPVSWGLWVAAHHPVAVAASAASLMAEAGLILLAVSATAGPARRSRRRRSRPVLRLLPVPGSALVALDNVAPRVAAVGWVAESRVVTTAAAACLRHGTARCSAGDRVAWPYRDRAGPLCSFPMYACTYASPAEYESSRRRKYQRVHAQTRESVGRRGRRRQRSRPGGRVECSERTTADTGPSLRPFSACAALPGPNQDVLPRSQCRSRSAWTGQLPLVERRSTSYSAKVPCGPYSPETFPAHSGTCSSGSIAMSAWVASVLGPTRH